MDALALCEVRRKASEDEVVRCCVEVCFVAGPPSGSLSASLKMESRWYRGRGVLDGGLLLLDVVAVVGCDRPVEMFVESEFTLERRDGPA